LGGVDEKLGVRCRQQNTCECIAFLLSTRDSTHLRLLNVVTRMWFGGRKESPLQ
jgi:hypothetical protein